MIEWSLSTELLSFVIIVMVALFSYDKKQIKNTRRKLFDFILGFSAGSILLNTLCVIGLEHRGMFPGVLNVALNTAYFLMMIWTCSLFAVYLFDLLLEHVYDKSCRTRAVIGLSVLLTSYTLIVLSNLWTGKLFWFDAQGIYHRGSWNRVGYLVLLIEIGMLFMCYRRNRASIDKQVRRVIFLLPPLVVLLAFLQLLFPEILLNGTSMAFAALILFVNFQNFQVGQDNLTGLGNRKSFFEELTLRAKGRQQFQILLVSIHGFAAVNQQFGYHKGDEFLYHIAKWLEEYPHGGKVFRFGNVTFALMCPYTDEEQSDELLSRIMQRFDEPWILGEIQYTLDVYFGTMTCLGQKLEITHIMEMLPLMIEFAKEKEQKVVRYDKEMELKFRRKKWLEELLQNSVGKHRFEVWYQPIFNCKEQRFEAAEALIRLRDYEGRLISPSDFIPLAEENGMIEDIGWFVLENVCRFLSEHPELPLQTVSINMSMQQFMNPHLLERITDCLARYELSADRIKLEITERVISYDMKYMRQQMEAFTKAGLKFYVDDFGTGYSNFSNVMHLPFECVKLDRSLFEKITLNSKDRMVVRSMIELFHSMELRVVAEGIETKKQQELLHQMDVEFIQGFYYSRPMPEQEVLAFMEEKELEAKETEEKTAKETEAKETEAKIKELKTKQAV